MESREDEGKGGRFDRERTRLAILAAAYEEFVENGLSGARVDAIAARTGSAKRMIYYYFGSKEGLYLAVLEQAYAEIREAERKLDLLHLDPVEAIKRMISFTFDYHDAHPGFSRLVSIENIHKGSYMANSKPIQALNRTVIDTLTAILEKGRTEGVFRSDIDPVDVHMLISAFCFFRVSNRYTFGRLFDRDLADMKLRETHKDLICEAVLRSLKPSQ